jgi:EmrB/QacA subfamily drug resistance transporter
VTAPQPPPRDQGGHEAAVTVPGADDGRFLWPVISVAFAAFLARLNSYTVNVSLPSIARAFGVDTSQVSGVTVYYLLVITCALLVVGRLGDRSGLKRIFVAGYAVFLAGSLLCGLSNSLAMLIAFRSLQAGGAAMLLALSFAIVARSVPRARLGQAFGITNTSAALGVAAGAPLGGIVAGYLSWHWVFLLNVPVALVGMVVSWRKIPDDAPPERVDGIRPRFDVLGSVLSVAGLAPLVYALNTGGRSGWTSPLVLGLLSAAAVALALFVWRETRADNPLLDLRLLRSLRFSSALLAALVAYMYIAGNAFLMPFYLQLAHGLNPQKTGLVLLSYSLTYVFLSPVAGRQSDKRDPGRLCVLGMLSAAACAFTFVFTLRLSALVAVFAYLLWMGLSFVLFLSPNNNLVMRLAPETQLGSVSSLFNTASNLGSILGVCAFELVFSAGLATGESVRTADLTTLPRAALLGGFSAAYILGGALCLLAMGLSTLGVRRRVTPAPAPPPGFPL